MAFGTRVEFDAVRELAFGSITASYVAVGVLFAYHARLICITNTTDVELYVSFDGTTNHLRLAANSFKLFDFTANEVQPDGLFVSKGTIIYAKRVSGAPTLGSIWAEVMHASGTGGT